MGVDEYMCSSYCPCITTSKAKQWLNSPPVDRSEPLVFNGKIKTYKQCIESYKDYSGSEDFPLFA